ncbi:glycosyltransferase [Hafnia paralvei]|uniref:glycosyltransferase family 4 protein n=1 Tax=Hafnia paralvei TaxID=546367 RepID=UPI000DF26479|nr:glycosyltransferase family 4 protein [Hafnia paralvei]MBU2673997.1 glycosyltransferase family 4 protein [Hafnia paralvei]RDA70562.1 glycosyltransferase [Hafnia paralvei]RDA71399.1 glycosyltransferase [Hafnia paralvei]RDA71451.1 glycosyltransferase [Hafnia paralvei]RDA80636.1 glycosyltransferase [Hafnia paralvei]
MKIFHVIPKIKHGGAENAAFSSIERLNVNNDFRLLALEKGKSLPCEHEQFIKCFNSSILNPLLYIRFLVFILKEKPDVVIFSLWKSSVCGLILCLFKPWLKLKKVVIIHSSRFAHFADKIVSKTAIKNFDRVYCDSNATRQFVRLHTNVSGETISFISRRVKRKKYFSPSLDNISFVYVGRVNKVKNIDAAIEFIYALKSIGMNVKFTLFGPDEGELSSYISKVKKLSLEDNVFFKGAIDHCRVCDELAKHDFYLQLSSAEGMGMSVIEAMQVGIVPCVTEVGEIPSYAKNNFNSVTFDAKKLSTEYFLEKANDLKRIVCEPDTYIEMSTFAAHTFDGESTYSEDLERVLFELVYSN